MEVVTGTYEEVLIGLRLIKDDDEYTLTETFTDKSNTGSIRCVTISPEGLLASGGMDEIVHIFSLKSHKLVGTLTHHSGTVTSLQFKDSHLFSTSEDGTLCLWRVSTWEPERTFKGHKGPVYHGGVHPTGKLTLTVGRDKTMRLWNNMTGRSSYISNLKEAADLVMWSPDGQLYLVVCGKTINIYSLKVKGLHKSYTGTAKVISIVFVTNNIIAFGGESVMQRGGRQNAVLYFMNIDDTSVLHQIPTESTRIRALAVCPSHEHPNSGEQWLTSISSDGDINVYRVTATEKQVEAGLMASKKIDLRLTCLAVTSPPAERQAQKRKLETEEADETISTSQCRSSDEEEETSPLKGLAGRTTAQSETEADQPLKQKKKKNRKKKKMTAE